jgi:aspartate carbamoyltransferase catalytic subunit
MGVIVAGVISALELDRAMVDKLFSLSDKFKRGAVKPLDRSLSVALAFFEPSTRTFSSFEMAAMKLGLSVTSMRSDKDSSMAKGETFADTVRMLSGYADLVVIRSRFDGSARFASEISGKAIINAGDGQNEHPTQSLIDMYTIREHFGKADNLTYAIVADLRHSRATNSLLYMLNNFRPKAVHIISPRQLKPLEQVTSRLKYECEWSESLAGVPGDVDVLYVNRLQKERFQDEMEYNSVKGSYHIDIGVAERMPDDSIILDPLPRVDELDRAIDGTDKAKYFVQAANGVPIRQAIMYDLLSKRR